MGDRSPELDQEDDVDDVVVGRLGALVAPGGVLCWLIVYWLVIPLRMARPAGR